LLPAVIQLAVRGDELPQNLPIDAATQLLSSAYGRAALAIEAGGDADEYRRALAALIDGLAALA
jgi:hypothetical protein